ncbi:peptidylprolyl isomerase [Pelagibius marinus]|uniref:peptidylprolyl isomerase n=1 Tax=Pelagibius marinus TaxID=2762760 RepID=UPI0018733B97|nr:peptidylprolyl isomerase [Pelagibius marinus]
MLLPTLLSVLIAGAAGRPLQAQEGGDPLPLTLPTPGGEGEASEAEVARLKDALKEMNAQNPVVARVNGHGIRWAEVVASAQDLPPRYRDQIESVFPALLDRLVDLRLLADAARAEGLRDDPVVRERLASFEDRVLSSVLLERYLNEKVSTADLRARYDALVAARRGDQEIRARHILVESEETAEEVIARLNQGEVFISLAKELSTGASAARGGDLGYFHPSRMAPAFAAAALALEPGEYTAAPVRTEFGWHVILLVDRRADNIPSFLDMQDKLREEARKEAVDQLVFSLRREASVEMFPEDGTSGAGSAQ